MTQNTTTATAGQSRDFACPASHEPTVEISVRIPTERNYDEFCPECDYPMFWAAEVMAAEHQWELDQAAAASAPQPVTPTVPSCVDASVCPNCGTDVSADARFCSACGASLTGSEDAIDTEGSSSWTWVALIVLAAIITTILIALTVRYWPL